MVVAPDSPFTFVQCEAALEDKATDRFHLLHEQQRIYFATECAVPARADAVHTSRDFSRRLSL